MEAGKGCILGSGVRLIVIVVVDESSCQIAACFFQLEAEEFERDSPVEGQLVRQQEEQTRPG